MSNFEKVQAVYPDVYELSPEQLEILKIYNGDGVIKSFLESDPDAVVVIKPGQLGDFVFAGTVEQVLSFCAEERKNISTNIALPLEQLTIKK
jgi:hypothetical protein